MRAMMALNASHWTTRNVVCKMSEPSITSARTDCDEKANGFFEKM